MATNPNLPGCEEAPATSTPRGSNRARNCLFFGRRRAAVAARTLGAPSSTSASTATGTPSAPTISGLTSTLTTSSRSATRPERDEHGRQRIPVDGGLAAERAEQALGAELVDHLESGHGVERGRAEHHVGDRLGEDAAEAEHHRRPELRIAEEPGDQLPVAADHGREQHVHRTVFRHRCPQQLGDCSRCRVGATEAEADETALGLVGDAVTVELGHDREPELGRSGRRLSRGGHAALWRQREPEAGEQPLRLRLGQRGRHRPPNVVTEVRPARRTGRTPPLPRRTLVGGARRTVSPARRRCRAGRRHAGCARPVGWSSARGARSPPVRRR